MTKENLPADHVIEFQYWLDIKQAVMVVKCPRCEGRGYHWGFGEDGFDPDWCSECGGSQSVCRDLLTPLET